MILTKRNGTKGKGEENRGGGLDARTGTKSAGVTVFFLNETKPQPKGNRQPKRNETRKTHRNAAKNILRIRYKYIFIYIYLNYPLPRSPKTEIKLPAFPLLAVVLLARSPKRHTKLTATSLFPSAAPSPASCCFPQRARQCLNLSATSAVTDSQSPSRVRGTTSLSSFIQELSEGIGDGVAPEGDDGPLLAAAAAVSWGKGKDKRTRGFGLYIYVFIYSSTEGIGGSFCCDASSHKARKGCEGLGVNCGCTTLG